MRANSMSPRSLFVLVSGTLLCSVLASWTSPQHGKTTAEKQQSPPARAEHWPALQSAVTQDPAVEERVEALLARMTLEEKIGQILQPEINEGTADDIRDYHLGSVLNGGGATPYRNKYAPIEDWVKMADDYYHASV